MFARISSTFLLSALALPILATASVLPRTGTPPPATIPASQCNTGDLQCCNSTESADNLSAPVAAIFALLGIDVGSITALVGVTCSPITVIGAGGTGCTAQPVCCTDNSFHGLVNIGCTPVNLGL